MSQLIIVEGNIGAGKTTFCENVSEIINYKVMYEPVTDNHYLEKFYEDPKRYALEMQFYLMSLRFKAHQEAILHIWTTGQGVIVDRSIYGDDLFCKRNYLDGNISEEGYQNYNKMKEIMCQFLMVPQLTIYLDVRPENCLKRIKMRNRDCEKQIPLEYLEGLEKLHSELLDELSLKGSKIFRLNWDSFDTFDNVVSNMKNDKLIQNNFQEYKNISVY